MSHAGFNSVAGCRKDDLARSILGDDFEVWFCESGSSGSQRWRPQVSSASASVQHDVGDEIQLHLSLLNDQQNARFEPLNGGRTLCLLNLGGHLVSQVAMKILPTGSAELMEIAVRAANVALKSELRHESLRRRLYESDAQLATFSNRIARGDAELSWLRNLATHSELVEAHNDPIQIAQKILPTMAQIITSCHVVYVAAPAGLDAYGVAMNAWQCGDFAVPDEVCRSLIHEFGAQALAEPLVLNFDAPTFRTAEYAGVLSAIVKAVRRGDRQSGWLLAINKNLQHLTESEESGLFDATPNRMCEFGGFEASLMAAAANTMAIHANNSHLLQEQLDVVTGTIRSLVNAIDAKDHYTCGHSDRVAEYARQIAATLGQDADFCERIYMTGLLHDVGKIGVPDQVLQKPDRLTEDEFEQIKKHPVIGHEILRHLANFDYVLPGVLHHHEAIDGSGYPNGLRGEQIPLDARILAVADAYDAMTSDRPYRKGMPSERAEAIIADGAGKQWDAECVAAFRKCLDGLRLIAHDRHRSSLQGPNFLPASIRQSFELDR